MNAKEIGEVLRKVTGTDDKYMQAWVDIKEVRDIGCWEWVWFGVGTTFFLIVAVFFKSSPTVADFVVLVSLIVLSALCTLYGYFWVKRYIHDITYLLQCRNESERGQWGKIYVESKRRKKEIHALQADLKESIKNEQDDAFTRRIMESIEELEKAYKEHESRAWEAQCQINRIDTDELLASSEMILMEEGARQVVEEAQSILEEER
ncbi:MAG: hypothetical protein ACWGQW_10695 [bacterium]